MAVHVGRHLPRLPGRDMQSLPDTKRLNDSTAKRSLFCRSRRTDQQFMSNNRAEDKMRQVLVVKLPKGFSEHSIRKPVDVDIRIYEINHRAKRSENPPSPTNMSKPFSSSRRKASRSATASNALWMAS